LSGSGETKGENVRLVSGLTGPCAGEAWLKESGWKERKITVSAYFESTAKRFSSTVIMFWRFSE